MAKSILDSFDEQVAKDKVKAEKVKDDIIGKIKKVTRKPNEPSGVANKPVKEEPPVAEPDKDEHPVDSATKVKPKGEVTPPGDFAKKSTKEPAKAEKDDNDPKDGKMAKNKVDDKDKEKAAAKVDDKDKDGKEDKVDKVDKVDKAGKDNKEPVKKSADVPDFAKSLEVIKKAYDLQNTYANKITSNIEEIGKAISSLSDRIEEVKSALVSHETGNNAENPEEETKKSVALEDKSEHIAKSSSNTNDVPAGRKPIASATEEVKKSMDEGTAVEDKTDGKGKPDGNGKPVSLAEEAENLSNKFFARIAKEHTLMDSARLNELNQLQGKVKYGSADNADLQDFIDFAKGK